MSVVAFLFSLTLYDVNFGQNRLREVFVAVPGLQNSLLAKTSKRFEEAFHVMMQRRGPTVPVHNNDSTENGPDKISPEQTGQEDGAALDSEVSNLMDGPCRK